MIRVLKAKFMTPFRAGRSAGGAAVEYVIVSTFATFLAITAVAAVSQVMKDKLKSFEEKLGITIDLGLDVFK